MPARYSSEQRSASLPLCRCPVSPLATPRRLCTPRRPAPVLLRHSVQSLLLLILCFCRNSHSAGCCRHTHMAKLFTAAIVVCVLCQGFFALLLLPE